MGRHKKDCKCSKCKDKGKVKKFNKCAGDFGMVSRKYKKEKITVKKVKKVKKDKKACNCRKRGKRCISPNPCTECIKQNEIEDAKSKIINKKRGRGRPKKVRVEEEVVVVPTFTYKFLGYCPSCKLSICDNDLVKGVINSVSCQKCGKVMKVNELVDKIELDRPKTKKEYFQSVNSVHTWHDYNASSNINSIAKKEDPMLDEIEDEHVKSDEDEIISKKIVED